MKLLLLLLVFAAPLQAALIRPTVVTRGRMVRLAQHTSAIDVTGAARAADHHLNLDLVSAFVAATERGDAAAAMDVCTHDFLYKTHRATTDNLAAAKERLHSKVPAPAKVTNELHEESPGIFVREIVVKPVPFVTVAVRQEFEVREDNEADTKLCRAEYIKL